MLLDTAPSVDTADRVLPVFVQAAVETGQLPRAGQVIDRLEGRGIGSTKIRAAREILRSMLQGGESPGLREPAGITSQEPGQK